MDYEINNNMHTLNENLEIQEISGDVQSAINQANLVPDISSNFMKLVRLKLFFNS